MEVGGLRTAQHPPGDHLRVPNGPDNHEARPRPRAHGQNHRPPQVMGHPICPS